MSLYLRGDTWWFDLYLSGHRVRRSTGFKDKDEAARVEREVLMSAPRYAASLSAEEKRVMLAHLFKIASAAAYRDAERGMISDMSSLDLEAMLIDCDYRCSFSGIPFSTKNDTNSRRRPWMPSLDRIDNSKPYSTRNCRLVCVAVNIALNDWGDKVLQTVAMGIVSRGAVRKSATV